MSDTNEKADTPNRRRLVIGIVVLVGLGAANVYLRAGGVTSSAVLPTGAVRGVVTYRGQPLNGGQVRFTSRNPDDKVGQASGMIDRDGRYEFAGVPIGPVTVTVDTSVRPVEDRFWKPGSKSPRPIYIPARFADPNQSRVSLDIKDGVLDFDINLD